MPPIEEPLLVDARVAIWATHDYNKDAGISVLDLSFKSLEYPGHLNPCRLGDLFCCRRYESIYHHERVPCARKVLKGNVWLGFRRFTLTDLAVLQEMWKCGLFKSVHVGLCRFPEERQRYMEKRVLQFLRGRGCWERMSWTLDSYRRLRTAAERMDNIPWRDSEIKFYIEHRRSRGSWGTSESVLFRQRVAAVVAEVMGWQPTVEDPHVVLVVSTYDSEHRSALPRCGSASVPRGTVVLGLKLPEAAKGTSGGRPRTWLWKDDLHQLQRSSHGSSRPRERRLKLKAVKDVEVRHRKDMAEQVRARASILQWPLRQERSVHTLGEDDPMFKFFERLLVNSCVRHRRFLRSPEFCTPPVLLIQSIELVSTPRLIKQYYAKLEEILSLRPQGCSPVARLAALKILSQPGEADLNQHFCFHGAPPDTITEIMQSGFDPRRGGEAVGMMFGRATYLAANASKADLYTDYSATYPRPRTATRSMIIARVVLGEAYRACSPMQQAVRPPDGPDFRPWDSVWAETRDNGGAVDHAEVMVYDKGQTYPQAVVRYIHSHRCACAGCLQRP